jgi:glyoxylase-like metal-dependent hydrolase (beta-lactamase superfamily II)
VPDALDGDVIDLEGEELRVITVGQSDTYPSTIVYVPSLAAFIAGDVAYNGIHQWLAQTDHAKRMQWIASVEQIEALEPKVVVAGHKRPDARDDDPATILGGTRPTSATSTDRFPRAIRPRSWSNKMMVLHGDLGNPFTLWTAAQGVFEQGTGSIVVSTLATQPARAGGEFAIGGDLPVVQWQSKPPMQEAR